MFFKNLDNLKEGDIINHNELHLVVPRGFGKKLNSIERRLLLIEDLHELGLELKGLVMDGDEQVVAENPKRNYVPVRKIHDASKRLKEYLSLYDKMLEMQRLIDKSDEIRRRSIGDMFGVTEEAAEAFEEEWNYARENGFVNERGMISLN